MLRTIKITYPQRNDAVRTKRRESIEISIGTSIGTSGSGSISIVRPGTGVATPTMLEAWLRQISGQQDLLVKGRSVDRFGGARAGAGCLNISCKLSKSFLSSKLTREAEDVKIYCQGLSCRCMKPPPPPPPPIKNSLGG